jgi:hypothetical protein
MLNPGLLPTQPTSADERRLLRLFRSLDPEAGRTLLAFAEFLGERGADAGGRRAQLPASVAEPTPEDRPAQETVIAAIKRLRRSYPMLDSGTMLHETSALMTAHVLQGRAAESVIDELEALFAARYAALKEGAS